MLKTSWDLHAKNCWDLHVENLLSKAGSRMYILRAIVEYASRMAIPRIMHLSKLFETLIISLFCYGIEVWGSALLKKYLERIDKFFRLAHRYGYVSKEYKMSELIEEQDKTLFHKIMNDPDHALYDLLPEKRHRVLRERGHPFTLPKVKTERFKRSFFNRCLFNYF